jgi:hypothetical protein
MGQRLFGSAREVIVKAPLSPSGSSPNKLGERELTNVLKSYALPQLVGGAVRRTEGAETQAQC